MFTLLLALGVFDPLPQEIHRFPGPTTANVQVGRCLAHAKRLEFVEGLRGWEGGRWQDAREETARRLRYWQCLQAAQHWWGHGERWQRQRLAQLRDMLTPEEWERGWHPPEIPEDEAFRTPVMPRAG